MERTPRVLSTTTGPPLWDQRVWTAVLHAGGSALVGGLTALEWRGLRNGIGTRSRCWLMTS